MLTRSSFWLQRRLAVTQHTAHRTPHTAHRTPKSRRHTYAFKPNQWHAGLGNSRSTRHLKNNTCNGHAGQERNKTAPPRLSRAVSYAAHCERGVRSTVARARREVHAGCHRATALDKHTRKTAMRGTVPACQTHFPRTCRASTAPWHRIRTTLCLHPALLAPTDTRNLGQ